MVESFKSNHGSGGGWPSSSPPVVGADANYYNRAYWRIIPQGGDNYLIQNIETQHYLFQTGDSKRGEEGGWLSFSGFQSPRVVGADANHHDLAYWKITPQGGNKYFIENSVTQRYLFQDGGNIKWARGAEGGWLSSSGFKSPNVVGADANYYNLAYWRLTKQR